ACAAVMAEPLVRKPPRTLGLIGCGGLGRWALRMFTAVFPTLETIYVSSLNSESRERFCRDMNREGGWDLVPVAEPSEAIQPADIVITSVPPSPRQPVEPGWLQPDALFIPLDLLNSWHDGVFSEAGLHVADSRAFLDRLLRANRPGLPAQKTIRFQDLNQDAPAFDAIGPTFISVCGIASVDVVIGWEIYRRACEAAVGTPFDMKASNAGM